MSTASAREKLLARLCTLQDANGGLSILLNALSTEEVRRDFAREHGLYTPWVTGLCVLEREAPAPSPG